MSGNRGMVAAPGVRLLQFEIRTNAVTKADVPPLVVWVTPEERETDAHFPVDCVCRVAYRLTSESKEQAALKYGLPNCGDYLCACSGSLIE